MNRRESIILTLDRIKVTKSLAVPLAEFIRLSREAGYEPVHSARMLENFRGDLARQRAALTRLTISRQEDFVTRQTAPDPIRRRAA